jgi:hypothetical protein
MEMIDSILRQIKPQVLSWISSWHGQQPYLLPFSASDYVGSGISSDGSAFSATVPSGVTVVSWLQTFYVATTNDASNCWTLALYRYAGAGIKIAELSTGRSSADTWTRLTVTVNAAIPSTDLLLYITATKTGSPGALSLAGPAVWVR